MKLGIYILTFFAALQMAHGKLIDRIVAIVNDEIVTQSDIESFQRKLKTQGLIDEALLNFYDAKEIKRNQQKLLDYLIDERLIDSEVTRKEVTAPIEKVEAEIRKIVSRSGTNREALKASLRKRGIRYSEYQNFIKTSIQRQNLLQREVSSKIKISDDDIAAYYIQKSKNPRALVFEYELAHILLSPKNGGAGKALERAKEVRKKLGEGANFEKLASQFSEDPRFTQGGLFGEVKIGEIVKPLEEALRNKSPGETTGIVKMQDGFHIFKILKRKLSPSPDFLKVKAKIAEILFAESFKRQYLSWIEIQRQTAYIKINKL